MTGFCFGEGNPRCWPEGTAAQTQGPSRRALRVGTQEGEKAGPSLRSG
jgi:hypothetical protein